VLGVGDAGFVKKSKAVMREKIQSDKTVVIVSHSASSIRSLCDRVIWVQDGRVREEGLPKPVLRKYVDWVEANKKR
jgi:ABC-type polysaccharide/polyol phosphate transport system ATPase subunit